MQRVLAALLACNGAAGSRGGKCVTQMTIKLEIKKINIGKIWPKTLYVLLVKLQKIAPVSVSHW